MRRWLIWIPVLMVASMLYWTVALGLGSLMVVSAFSQGGDRFGGGVPEAPADVGGTVPLVTRDGNDPIVVHLEESVEPEDVNDNAGCSGPGQTAF